ncbi:gluconokinase [Arthrobacter castelli]|uniref:gluconokinase n=1 Tax=Arthrobacter castelli TaxID=271431 RepID=UPI00047A9DAA|nr:gluconokinase [Arthrobacter castelli]
MSEPNAGHQIVVMGVSGSGKSTIGALIADALGVNFVDGDSLHPMDNVAKMAAGEPLTDTDRWPWLATVGQELDAAGSTGLVVACSALKRSYRTAILADAPAAVFVHLDGSRQVLSSRMEGRSDHFMPPALLESQLATLQRLQPAEPGFTTDIDRPVADIVDAALAQLAGQAAPATPPS